MTADPCPVKTFLVTTANAGCVTARPIRVQARTASTEGGVLTLRGTATHLAEHVITYGPGFWAGFTVEKETP